MLSMREKVRKAFSNLPESRGFLDLYPKSPLKLIDDPIGRCYHIYDGDGKEFLSISVTERQALPRRIKRYFSMTNSEREAAAVKELSEYVNLKACRRVVPDQIFANQIVESLRTWSRSG